MKQVKKLHVIATISIVLATILFLGLACCNLPIFTSSYLLDSIVSLFTGGWLDSTALGDSAISKMIWAIVYMVIMLAFVVALVILIVRAKKKKAKGVLGVGITTLVIFFVIVSFYFFAYYGDITSTGNRVDTVFLNAFTALGDANKLNGYYYQLFLEVLGLSLFFIIYLVIEITAYIKTIKAIETTSQEETQAQEDDFSRLSEEDVRKAVREELEAFYGTKQETKETHKEVAEEPKEEVKEETPVEEVKEEPKEEVKEVVVEEVIQEETPVEETSEQASSTSERKSFFERILLVDEEQLEIYNEIKNDILSYGVKSRVASQGDTFRLHRVTYMKMVFSGKKVKLYMKLDPKEFADSTIPHGDASDKKLYEEIPFVFKVKSGLSIRRAKALIAEMMQKAQIERKAEPGNHDYAHELIKKIQKENLK